MRFLRAALLILTAVDSVRPNQDAARNQPNIVFIVADDMGWNDVSFHGSDQIPTPNIDSIGYQGVILNRHYVQPVCTPSRVSLMTGKYPVHTGIHEVFFPSHRAGLNLSEKILPQYLKEIGYSTHMVGKWHLGYFDPKYTPLERGFDSFFGYLNGAISYYDHICEQFNIIPPYNYKFSGHDLRRNYTTAWDLVGQYATDVFTREAIQVIKNHPKEKPLFLYLPHLAPHAGNEGKWLEAPQDEINKFSYIRDPNRRTYAAMVSRLDKSVGAVIKALEMKNMLQNSIIVFMSDNGAPMLGPYRNWGSNYPWRGQKSTLWEGGVRTPVAVWSPLIKNPSRVSYDLMHITDWFPTLLAAAGCEEQLNIDGVNQWLTISEGYPSPRKQLVVEIDPKNNMSAVVLGNFKYIKGPTTPRFGPNSEVNNYLNFHLAMSKSPEYNVEELTKCPTWKVLQKFSPDKNLQSKVQQLRSQATVNCMHDFDKVLNCVSSPCLFNIDNDPCELYDVSNFNPDVMMYVSAQIESYKLNSVQISVQIDPASNPDFFNGTWNPWVFEK